MKPIAAILCLGASLLAGRAFAQSTTYRLTSVAPYTAADPAYDCPNGPCPQFDTTMGVSGSFTVSKPLPRLASSASILPYVSGYSFSNGLREFTDRDPLSRLDRFLVSTDASGRITSIEAMRVYRWLGQGSKSRRTDHIRASGSHAEGHANLYCQSGGTNQYGVEDTCLGASIDSASASAIGAATAVDVVTPSN
jgi:hypothetical protein